MQKKIYTIHDSKAEAFMNPFFLNSKGEAIRTFTEAVNDPQSTISKYPDDFTLFEIGIYDTDDGLIETYEAKKSLGNALEYKKEN